MMRGPETVVSGGVGSGSAACGVAAGGRAAFGGGEACGEACGEASTRGEGFGGVGCLVLTAGSCGRTARDEVGTHGAPGCGSEVPFPLAI